MSREEQNNSSPFPTKVEKKYLNFCRQYPDQVIMSHESSVQEGFEYLFGAGFEGPMGAGKPTFTKIAKRFRSRGGITMMKIMVKYGPKMIKGIKRCFQDLDPYLTELETSAFKIKQQKNLDPDIGLWNELQEYASNKWDIIKIGFTELPNQLIFKDKCVLFGHALVFIQEMKKDKNKLIKLGQNAKKAIKYKYNLAAIAEKYYQIIKELNCK